MSVSMNSSQKISQGASEFDSEDDINGNLDHHQIRKVSPFCYPCLLIGALFATCFGAAAADTPICCCFCTAAEDQGQN